MNNGILEPNSIQINEVKKMKYVMSLDQGTTSTRAILFDHQGQVCSSSQREHHQYFVKPGWVEHDPAEIWNNSKIVIRDAIEKVGAKGKDIVSLGITNQRETILAWEPETGNIRHRAIVWQDLRGDEIINRIKERASAEEFTSHSGLLFSPYFSASKISWMLENSPRLRVDAENGKVVFGTIDTYLVWSLLGKDKNVVITDATNASRYALMNIETLTWDDWLLDLFDIPKKSLPTIVPSFGEVYGTTSKTGFLSCEIPVAGILGDQQAALFGQACFTTGKAKNTYGTGCFLLVNTGETLTFSSSGLLSTVAFLEKGKKPHYALEGSIAVAGSLVQWLRDNLQLVDNAPEVDMLAESVPDCGGVYIVPAFSGLYAPYWRSDARGVIAGLTGFATKAHICRAALESTAFQAKDIFDAIEKDANIKIKELRVDGGLTNSRPLMEFQADLLQAPVVRPQVIETTALGAAYAAGLTVGFWKDIDEISTQWKEKSRWVPTMSEELRSTKCLYWSKAVDRTLDWAENE